MCDDKLVFFYYSIYLMTLTVLLVCQLYNKMKPTQTTRDQIYISICLELSRRSVKFFVVNNTNVFFSHYVRLSK